PQAMSEPKTTNTIAMIEITMASASSLGKCACSHFCIGHESAMMKKAQAMGASTVLAKYAPVSTAIAARAPTATSNSRSAAERLGGADAGALGISAKSDMMGSQGDTERASLSCDCAPFCRVPLPSSSSCRRLLLDRLAQ